MSNETEQSFLEQISLEELVIRMLERQLIEQTCWNY